MQSMMGMMFQMMGMMMLMMMGLMTMLMERQGQAPEASGESSVTGPSGQTNGGGGEVSGNASSPSSAGSSAQPAVAAAQPSEAAGQPAAAANGPAPQPAAQTVTNIGGNRTNDPDLNLEMRGYTRTGGASGLTNVGGPTDPKAPQLAGLFSAKDGMPQISSTWQINAANGNMPGGPMVGFRTRPGQNVLLPNSGYQIDGAGHQARVLYNDGNWLVLNYTADNTIANGYTIHIKGLDTDLQPGTNVSAADVLGQAQGEEILLSIRDTGSFMGPSIQKDWWQNTAQPNV